MWSLQVPERQVLQRPSHWRQGASVALFEKQRSLGGTSNFFHGTFAVETEIQRERFIETVRTTLSRAS